MELKYNATQMAAQSQLSSNRTFMELKLNKTLKTILQVMF